MIIRLISDIHLEAFSNSNEELINQFAASDDRDAESVLVLAGDISSNKDQLIQFLTGVAPRFKHTFFVGGNHEGYKHHFQEWNSSMRERFDVIPKLSAAVLDEVLCQEYDGTRFIYGTLWADGGPTLADKGAVGFYLNDFRLIRWENRKFRVPDMIELNRCAKARIKEFLETPFDGKTVVITHHLPSRRCVSDRFWPGDGSDGANGGFASNCDALMAADSGPALWVHGHTHDFIDTTLWNTRVLCNPTGYRGEWANGSVGGPVMFAEV